MPFIRYSFIVLLLFLKEPLRQCVTNATFKSCDLVSVNSTDRIKHHYPVCRVIPILMYASPLISGSYGLFQCSQSFGINSPVRHASVSWAAGSQENPLTTVLLCVDVFGCVHRRNPYIRLDLGFQYGRFSCDGSRFLFIMHCIVNVENHQYLLPEYWRQIYRVFPGNTLFNIFVGHSLGLWLGINLFYLI